MGRRKANGFCQRLCPYLEVILWVIKNLSTYNLSFSLRIKCDDMFYHLKLNTENKLFL